jgi:chaperonin cofactor prefoldin
MIKKKPVRHVGNVLKKAHNAPRVKRIDKQRRALEMRLKALGRRRKSAFKEALRKLKKRK